MPLHDIASLTPVNAAPARATIGLATVADAIRVARAMRAGDRREIMALRPAGTDPAAVAAEAVGADGAWCFCARLGGRPVAVIGAVEVRPALWSVYLFATDRWPRVAGAVFRFARRSLIPGLLAAGANRAECRAIAGHAAAHRWLERLGAVHEADMIDCGPGRQTFRLYAWRRRDFGSTSPRGGEGLG